MEITILKDEKDELEIQLDNQTVAEILRVYLNEDSSIELGAWKKEHYSKPVIFKVISKGKSPKKAVQDAISRIQKDLKKYSDEFKKVK
jgi:DNA-directed RNA polymerase subunit L